MKLLLNKQHKFFFFLAILTMAFGTFLSCEKAENETEGSLSNSNQSKEGKLIPIAEINSDGKLTLLFNQLEIINYFSENSEIKLLLADIIGAANFDVKQNCALMTKIYNANGSVTSTAWSNLSKVKIDANTTAICYSANGIGGVVYKVTCTTTDPDCSFGCDPEPQGTSFRCSPCFPKGVCKRESSAEWTAKKEISKELQTLNSFFVGVYLPPYSIK